MKSVWQVFVPGRFRLSTSLWARLGVFQILLQEVEATCQTNQEASLSNPSGSNASTLFTDWEGGGWRFASCNLACRSRTENDTKYLGTGRLGSNLTSRQRGRPVAPYRIRNIFVRQDHSHICEEWAYRRHRAPWASTYPAVGSQHRNCKWECLRDSGLPLCFWRR